MKRLPTLSFILIVLASTVVGAQAMELAGEEIGGPRRRELIPINPAIRCGPDFRPIGYFVAWTADEVHTIRGLICWWPKIHPWFKLVAKNEAGGYMDGVTTGRRFAGRCEGRICFARSADGRWVGWNIIEGGEVSSGEYEWYPWYLIVYQH